MLDIYLIQFKNLCSLPPPPSIENRDWEWAEKFLINIKKIFCCYYNIIYNNIKKLIKFNNIINYNKYFIFFKIFIMLKNFNFNKKIIYNDNLKHKAYKTKNN